MIDQLKEQQEKLVDSFLGTLKKYNLSSSEFGALYLAEISQAGRTLGTQGRLSKKYYEESLKLLPEKNYIGISLTQGNIYRKKEWPLYKFIKLSEELIKYNKIPVFFIEKKYQEIKNQIKDSIPSALFPEHETKLNCPALVTCLATRLDLAITIDNGIMHMLSLSKVPIVTLFGPTDAEKFAPKYKNSKILDSKKIYNSKNVSDITVEDVLQAARQLVNF